MNVLGLKVIKRSLKKGQRRFAGILILITKFKIKVRYEIVSIFYKKIFKYYYKNIFLKILKSYKINLGSYGNEDKSKNKRYGRNVNIPRLQIF